MDETFLAALEAILFVSGEPIATRDICTALECTPGELRPAIDTLMQRYTDGAHGITLQRLGDSYQFCTKPEYAEAVARAADTRRQAPLSAAAMEVLTIAAYHQPVSKGFIARICGVDRSSVVNGLVARGLLAETGRLDLPGHPIGYRTTENFLRCFGLESLDDLPPLDTEKQEDPSGGAA